MIKTLLVAGTTLGLVLATGAASAGPCSTEIDTLQKQLSSTDAGMGPTGTGEVAETGNLHPPTDTMNQATEGKAASPGDVASAEPGRADRCGSRAGRRIRHLRRADRGGSLAGARAPVRPGRRRSRLHGRDRQAEDPARRAVMRR